MIDLLPAAQDPVLEGKCFGCRMPPFACFCAEIPVIHTTLRFVLIRHCAEIARTSNTGRVVARALPSCTMIDHGVAGQPLDLTGSVGPDAWVLYPGSAPPRPTAPIRTLVVLDGSWSHVRTMRRRIPPLAELPSLTLPAPTVAPLRIRRGELPEQLATIEAVAAALDFVGEPEPAAQVRALFALMAGRMRDLRGFEMPPKRSRFPVR
ncbi:MAG: tRNA-uridine aminocarboxypropyltransferase [Pseudomonadota bacterium]|nr:tRNA-uridine aminocarboxypropyltransferase [Pseudomonadota bacterium]